MTMSDMDNYLKININKGKIDEKIVGYYYLQRDFFGLHVLDLMDFVWEDYTFEDEIKIKEVLDFICNNPSKFVNLYPYDNNNIMPTSKFPVRTKYGIINVIDNTLHFNNLCLRIVCEKDGVYTVLCNNIIVDFFTTISTCYFVLFGRDSYINIGVYYEYEGTTLSYLSRIIKIGSDSYSIIKENTYDLSTQIVPFYLANTYRDCINRGFLNKEVLLKYFNYVNDNLLNYKDYAIDTIKQLNEYYPDVITDKHVAIITRNSFVGV